MVRRSLPNGGHYYEPPFTPEEEDTFYRHFGGPPVGVLRGKKASPAPAPEVVPKKKRERDGR